MQNKNSLVSVSGTFLRKKFTSLLSTTALVVAGSALPLLSPFSIHSAMANNGNVCNGSSGDVVCFNSGQEQFNDTGQVNSFTVNPNVALTNVGNNAIITLDAGGSAINSINISPGASVTQGGFSQAIDLNVPVTQFTNDGTISITGFGQEAINLNDALLNGNSSITNNGVIESTDVRNSQAVIFLSSRIGPTVTFTNSAGATISKQNSRGNVVTLAGSFESRTVFVNEGTISGARHPIFADVGNETVINSGLIRASERNSFFGNVSLSSGNDIFEVRAGSQVLVGTGTDKGVVNGGNDTDTLRFGGATTQSFNLDEIGTNYINFENFEVTGSQVNFSGTTTEEFTVDPRASNQLFALARQAAVVAGPVQRVIPTAILSGNGTFGELTINSGGGLSPGNSIGTTTINEDLQFNTGSTLIIEVSQSGADQVVVGKGGNVRIFGGTLELRDLAPALQDASQTFVIIDNQGKDQVQTGMMGPGAVGFDEVVDNLAFLTPQVTLTGGDGNDVEVSFTADGGANGEIFSMLQTNTPNQGNVGRALDGLDNTEGSEGKQLRDSLLVLTEDQARQTFTDLSGDIHSSGTQNFFDVGNQVGDAIGGRFSNLGGFGGGGGSFALSQSFSFGAAWPGTVPAKQHADALDAGDFLEAERKNSIWGSLTGHYSELDGTGNGTGVQSDGFGFVGGVDQKITENTTVGISGGYASSDVSSASGNSDLDIDSLTVALYGLHELDALTFSGFAAYTYHDVDGTRRIPILGLTANSDYSADQFTLQGEVNYRIENAFDAADAIPFINGRYVNVDSDAFTETGAGAANLISSGTSSDAFDLTGGMRFEAVTTTGKAFVGAGYQYRFGDVATDTTFTFAGGGTFTAQGVERDRGSAFVEAGLEMDLKDNLSLFANGAANFGGDFEAYSGSAGLKLEF